MHLPEDRSIFIMQESEESAGYFYVWRHCLSRMIAEVLVILVLGWLTVAGYFWLGYVCGKDAARAEAKESSSR